MTHRSAYRSDDREDDDVRDCDDDDYDSGVYQWSRVGDERYRMVAMPKRIRCLDVKWSS